VPCGYARGRFLGLALLRLAAHDASRNYPAVDALPVGLAAFGALWFRAWATGFVQAVGVAFFVARLGVRWHDSASAFRGSFGFVARFRLFVRRRRWLCFTGQSRRRWAVGSGVKGSIRLGWLFSLPYWASGGANRHRCSIVALAPWRSLGFLFSGGVVFNALFGLTRRSNGTRRPLAVLKFGFYHGFRASLGFIERAPLSSTLGYKESL